MDAEFSFSVRTARRYMQMAATYSEDEADSLPASKLYDEMSAAKRKHDSTKNPPDTDAADEAVRGKWKPLGNHVRNLVRAADEFAGKAAALTSEEFVSLEKEQIVAKTLAAEIQQAIRRTYAGLVSVWKMAHATNGKASKEISQQLARAKHALEQVEQSLAPEKGEV